MFYGWAGANLEIDLSRANIERKGGDPKLYETYLGGKGIGAKLFWDRVPPEAAPFSPDNLLIITTGVLVGTSAPTANRACISFKSPQTNLFSYCVVGGQWAAELKHAGYDTVVISGKSPTPVYLWINNDNIEIRDASHLWGKDTFETCRIIREELKNDKVQILCIGPAGENRVYAASIEHNIYSSASRTGVGAVMGAKKLKAIAGYGTKDTNIAKPSEFFELCESVLKRAEDKGLLSAESPSAGEQRKCDTGWFGNADERPDGLGFENYDKIIQDYVNKFLVGDQLRVPCCYNCPVGCSKLPLALPDGGVHFYKTCISCAFSFACKISDVTFALKCYDLCGKYGLDILSTGKLVGFAIDLYQKGILTKEDTDGMHLEYGNEEIAFTLIEKIARREGLGDTLANGVYEAAQVIGRGAEEHAHLVKKLELMADFTKRNPPGALILATNDRACYHANAPCLMRFPSDPLWNEGREEYLKGGWWPFPRKFEKYLDVDYSVDYEGVAEFTHYNENIKTLTDLTGLCWFRTGFLSHPIIRIDTMIDLISYATGMDINESEALKIAGRTTTLIRANNVRLGLRREDDTVPEKLFREAPPLRQKPWGFVKLDHDKFDKELDKYYELRGWNSEGIPTRETLEELSLDFVIQDLL